MRSMTAPRILTNSATEKHFIPTLAMVNGKSQASFLDFADASGSLLNY